VINPAHGLHSVSRLPNGYQARCLCGWACITRMTPQDALGAHKQHALPVPYPRQPDHAQRREAR
jgi:hypothetical protein